MFRLILALMLFSTTVYAQENNSVTDYFTNQIELLTANHCELFTIKNVTDADGCYVIKHNENETSLGICGSNLELYEVDSLKQVFETIERSNKFTKWSDYVLIPKENVLRLLESRIDEMLNGVDSNDTLYVNAPAFHAMIVKAPDSDEDNAVNRYIDTINHLRFYEISSWIIHIRNEMYDLESYYHWIILNR